jgi:hypothetical protein
MSLRKEYMILTIKQKNRYKNELQQALRKLKKTVQNNPLIEEVVLDTKRKSAGGEGWSDITDTDIILTKKGDIQIRVSESNSCSDGSEKSDEWSKTVTVDNCPEEITLAKIDGWIHMLVK